MVKRWILDTNAWIHYLRDPASPVRWRLQKRKGDEIFSCSVVRAELMHGARKYGLPAARAAAVERAPAPFVSLPFDDVAADHYAQVRHELELDGKVIGPADLMIAAICLAHGCTLASANLGEFRRVRGLEVEDWSVAMLDA